VDAEARGDLEPLLKNLENVHEDEQQLNIYLNQNKFGNETAQGYRNIATGFRNDKTAVKFQNTYGTAVPQPSTAWPKCPSNCRLYP
jgi:hypothetical protein